MADEGELIPENLRQPTSSSSSSSPLQRSIADYNTIKEIGEGSFSTVYHAREMFDSRRDVAIKMCLKQQILREKRTDAIMREKNILARLSTKENMHPYIIGLYCTLQDTDHLYFVVTYASEGDLATILKKMPQRRFEETHAQFYAAELLVALEHIHSLGVIHRDVKPDNILIQTTGHILLSDFGSAMEISQIKDAPTEKMINDRPKRRASFVGTAQFVTPEMLKGEVVNETCDYWALGVSLYQFLTGRHCFHDESEYLIFQRIQKLLYKFPDDFSVRARSLVENLLVLKPSKRLGSKERGGIAELKSHPFFETILWGNLTSTEPPKLNFCR